jgi:hypothetical protein
MRWLLLAGMLSLAACNGPTLLTGGQHIQAHGRIFRNISELTVSGGGMILRFADGGVSVICSPAGCLIGQE